MSENVEFAVDVLYAIRSGLGSRTLPHAFESGADGDVLSDAGTGEIKTELSIRTAASVYGLGAGGANGVLTPDPTPQKSGNADERLKSRPSAQSLGSPSKLSKGSLDRQILTPTKAGTF